MPVPSSAQLIESLEVLIANVLQFTILVSSNRGDYQIT